jgi:hypothetical protein
MKANETNNTNPIQRVSKCESVVFCGAAASPQGWPPPKTSLFIQKVFDYKWHKSNHQAFNEGYVQQLGWDFIFGKLAKRARVRF